MLKRFAKTCAGRPRARAIAALLAALAALPAAFALGQSGSLPNSLQGPDSSKTGQVQGTVVSRKTGQPAPGVTVRLTEGPVDRAALQKLLDFFATRGVNISLPNGEPDGAFYQTVIDAAASRGVSLMNPEVQNAIAAFENAHQSRFVSVSDSEGHFLIANVIPGKYEVIAEAKDHFGPGSSADHPPLEAEVRAGDTVNIRVAMTPGAVISGHVSNAAGSRLSNMIVQALVLGYQDGYPILVPGATATTDDQGEYKLFWLPPGDYFVATMPPRGRKPPPVDGKDPIRTFYPRTRDALTAQPVKIRGGEELGAFNIEMQMSASFKISGEITSFVPPSTTPGPRGGNVGAAIATLSILARDPSVPESVGSRGFGTVQVAPVGDNTWRAHFEVEGIQPGLYDIGAWVRESNPDGGSGITIGRTPIEVRDKDLDGVEIKIFPSVRILGKVTLDGHAPGPVTARVSLQPEGSAVKIPVYQGIGLRAVVANPQDGTFMVPAVTSGQFRVQVQGLPPDVYVADVLQGGVSIDDSGFTVAGKTPDLIEVVLKSGSGTVEGKVKDGAGKPMAGATVVLAPPVSRRSNRSLYQTATTDADGHFSIRGVAPENYQVYAWQQAPPGAYYNERFLSAYQDRGRPLSVNQKSRITTEVTGIEAEAR